MVRPSSLARAGNVGRLVRVAALAALGTLAVVACGGKIAPSGDDIGRTGSGPFDATGDVVGTPTHKPASAPVTVPAPTPTGSSHRSETWVNGPIGFVVQDAFSFDTGPTSNRELRGVWITSFTPACDKTMAVPGSGVLRIDFSEQADTVPPGTYPFEGPSTPDAKTAYAQVWWVTAAGCGAAGTPGAHFESGSVTIDRSDATGMVGSFEGILVDFDGNSSPVDGHFDAPRCPTGGGACSP